MEMIARLVGRFSRETTSAVMIDIDVLSFLNDTPYDATVMMQSTGNPRSKVSMGIQMNNCDLSIMACMRKNCGSTQRMIPSNNHDPCPPVQPLIHCGSDTSEDL